MQHRRGKQMTGALFPNDPPTRMHPAWRGELQVGGRKYRVAAWEKVSRGGDKYLSLALSLDDGREPDRRTGPERVLVATCGPPRSVADGQERSRHPGEAEATNGRQRGQGAF